MSPILPRILAELRLKTEEARLHPREATGDELRVYAQARSRAQRKAIVFNLSKDDYKILVTRANGRCEETDRRFEKETNSTGRYRDNWMSIDRINSRGSYSLENCRLVTAAVNFAKGDMPIQQYHILKLMYLIKMNVPLDEDFFLSREGDDPDKWQF